MYHEVRDKEARKVAYEAARRIETHEQVCTERYEHINTKLDNLARQIGPLVGRVWWMIATAFAGMGGVIWWLAGRAF